MYVPDVCSSVSEIIHLLGAKALSLIYTRKLIKLESGLTAVETHLDFALMSKDIKIKKEKSLSAINEQQNTRSAMSMLSNQLLSLHVRELRSMENIGIRDPGANLKKRKLNSEIIKWFEIPNWLREVPEDWYMTKIDWGLKR
ncbi:hypothetical protein TNCV_2579781 [Trichonephila clavipes]|uniref:Uncharacterized protein n=1 Tax=Trichonephila clavipes TaxID=2585209 RepID=A0A8X6S7I4_TRICX|nr:hypothetical protein TNCV_2579781 [Trichonephila clavipes]